MRPVSLVRLDRYSYGDDFLGDIRAVFCFRSKRWRVTQRRPGNTWVALAEGITRKAEAMRLAETCIASTYGRAA